MRAPELRIYKGPPNAVVVPGHGPVALADSALDQLARTELEAVLAHCLVRLAHARRTDPVGYADDVRAVALTRYPPGLAKALERLVPQDSHWFVVASVRSHRPVAERIAALEEL